MQEQLVSILIKLLALCILEKCPSEKQSALRTHRRTAIIRFSYSPSHSIVRVLCAPFALCCLYSLPPRLDLLAAMTISDSDECMNEASPAKKAGHEKTTRPNDITNDPLKKPKKRSASQTSGNDDTQTQKAAPASSPSQQQQGECLQRDESSALSPPDVRLVCNIF